jgi:hypothetical protein
MAVRWVGTYTRAHFTLNHYECTHALPYKHMHAHLMSTVFLATGRFYARYIGKHVYRSCRRIRQFESCSLTEFDLCL